MSDATPPAGAPVLRDEKGRWLKPPKSPGRPRGLSQSEKVRALIEPHRKELVDRTIELALRSSDGQVAARALEMALSRLAPAPKQESERIEVPGLAEATTFVDKADAVIRAVASGAISAEAGERVLRLLDVYRRAHETDALERRVAALESGRKASIVDEEGSR